MIEGVNIKDAELILEDDEGNLYVVHDRNKPATKVSFTDGYHTQKIEIKELKDMRDELSRVKGSSLGVD